MFCDQCGTPMNDTQAYCPSCGKAAKAAVPPIARVQAPPAVNRVSGHVRLLGVFWLLYSAWDLMASWLLSSIFPRFVNEWGGLWHIPFPVGGIFRFVGGILLIRGVAGIIAGWGLLDRQPWARILAIVLGVLALPRIFLGTVLGIYTLWVLLPGESEREYRQISRA